jgi:hypothetical protein
MPYSTPGGKLVQYPGVLQQEIPGRRLVKGCTSRHNDSDGYKPSVFLRLLWTLPFPLLRLCCGGRILGDPCSKTHLISARTVGCTPFLRSFRIFGTFRFALLHEVLLNGTVLFQGTGRRQRKMHTCPSDRFGLALCLGLDWHTVGTI